MTTGTLTGIGIGPGDPDLITLKGLKALQAAPVLAYPAPESGDSLARRIVEPHLDGHHIEICIRMPMVTARFPAQEVYTWASERIAEHLDAGRDVACVCEGDPFVYGSFSFLFARLVERYPVRVIPGVSSVTACAAVMGTPLATRNDVFSVLPATLDEQVLRRQLEHLDAAAIIKVGRHLPKVRRVLEALDVGAMAHYVERATMSNERSMPLSDFDQETAPYFSMILLHKRGFAWQ